MTLWYSSRKPENPGALLAMKWSHNVTFEENFQCECGARESAQKLALEMNLAGCHQGSPMHSSPSSSRSSLRSRTSRSLRVGFADWTCLYIGEEADWRLQKFCLPSFYFASESTPWSGCPMIADLRASRFQVRPWHDGGLARSCYPTTMHKDTRIAFHPPGVDQYKIIDNQLDNPARRLQEEPTEPDPDVIPDINEAPAFAQDLHAIGDEQEVFSDPDGDGILRLRTWYIHHGNHPVNFHSRLVELEEDWRRWEDDIVGSWRSHLHAGASIFFHLVFPDPYRGYLRQRVHGDIIITQGNDLPRRAGLITVHYHGRDADPHSYALASSLELMVSGRRITEAADADQWCNRDHYQCTISHGWDRIPFDHRPVHHMQHGHSFVVTVTDSNEDRAGRRLNMPQQTGPSHLAADHEDLDYDDYEAASIHDATPSHGSSSGAPRPEEEVGVHIFRLERPDGHCFLRWSSHRRILFDLTRCLLMRRNDVVGIHPMIVLPIGLQEPHEKAVIMQSRVDLLPGSREQLVLIDLEIHFHALPDGLLIPPAVTRKVYRILPPVHRSQILILLGLFDYCELHGDHCTIFHDHLIWHLQDRTLHDLQHGTYVRVIVPPPADTTLDTQRAIAISRDFALEAHRPYHRPDCQAQGSQSWRRERSDDHSTLFQLDMQACQPLPARYKVAPDQVVQPALLGTSAGSDLPVRAPRPLTRFHDRDFETLQNLFQSLSLIECEEEGQVAYVDTWYVHHSQHSRCTDPRAVKLYQDPASWLEDLIAPWEDIIDETIDIVLYLVRPTPPCTIMECLLAHIIIEQAPRPDMVVGLITTHDSSQQSALIDHTAWSLPSLITANSTIRLADHQVECRLRRCIVRRGPLPFDPFDFDEIESGVGLVIYLQPSNTGWLGSVQGDESDQSSLIQTPGILLPALEGIDVPHNDPHQRKTENFAFNPFAKRFCPGSHSHSSTFANVQELQDLWRRSAFSWEGEEVVINVVTWFVDQFNQALHSCWRPRPVRLQGEAQDWERQLRLAWHDLQLPGAPILIHVVQPSPPSRDQHFAAHVLLIQNPLDEVSSSLLTVFDTERDLSGPTMQFAVTTRDTLALDDIINDLGLTARCLSPNAPSICGAWIGTQLLVLGRPTPLSDGSGILFQVSRRPTNQDIQAHLAGTNLLQISARRKEGTRRRLTHGLVAHTHGPSAVPGKATNPFTPIRLRRTGDLPGPLPSFIEISGPPSPLKVKQALSSFGIPCEVALLSDDFTALVFPLDFQSGPEANHFVYVFQTDPQEIHLHTFESGTAPDELDHMRHLYQLGFEKAVILSNTPHEVGIRGLLQGVDWSSSDACQKGQAAS